MFMLELIAFAQCSTKKCSKSLKHKVSNKEVIKFLPPVITCPSINQWHVRNSQLSFQLIFFALIKIIFLYFILSFVFPPFHHFFKNIFALYRFSCALHNPVLIGKIEKFSHIVWPNSDREYFNPALVGLFTYSSTGMYRIMLLILLSFTRKLPVHQLWHCTVDLTKFKMIRCAAGAICARLKI